MCDGQWSYESGAKQWCCYEGDEGDFRIRMEVVEVRIRINHKPWKLEILFV